MSDSIIVDVYVDYIDDVFGEKKLWPSDPYARAQSSLILDAFGNKVSLSPSIYS